MIYFLRNPRTGHIKIGCTTRPLIRFREHVGMHGVLEMLGAMEGGQDTEWQLHRAFRDDRIKKKQSRTTLEWFYPVDDLMRYIADNADLPVLDEWHKVLQIVVHRERKPYPNRDLFVRLVKRIDQENTWMSTNKAARMAGIPPAIVNALLNNKVQHITAVNLPHYQRLADWLGCSVDDLTSWKQHKTTCARCDNPRHVTSGGKMLGYCRDHWNQIINENAKRKRRQANIPDDEQVKEPA